MVNRFNVVVKPILDKYKNYYDGKQKILYKQYADPTKPCSKSVINYCKNIVDSYAGYLATPGFISYKSENDIEEVMDILRYNDFQAQDNAFLLDALIYGKGAELMYIDRDSKPRFRTIDPRTCFGVYDDSLTGDLLYFVRFYKASEWDDSNIFNLDVYTDQMIRHYEMRGMNGQIIFLKEEPHFFTQCPANIFYLFDEKAIFDCVLSLQDAVNEVINSEIDDYSAFCDAYMVLEGVVADEDDVVSMRENRILQIPQGSKASWLTKSANDVQVENILKRLHEAIYRVAQCPDFSSESFVGGVSSGIAIQYRLTGMETKAGAIEGAMKKALQRRIEIICGIISLKLGEEIYRDIDITFKRNIPEDINNTINMINALKGTVSDATLLAQLDFINDVNAELEAVAEQRSRQMELYSFSPIGFDDDEGDED